MGEGNVWIQQFAAVADFALSLLGCSKKTETTNAGGLSPVVPESVAAITSTLNDMTVLVIERTSETSNALFGKAIIGNEFVCFTMERTAVSIPVGTYQAHTEISPHFGFATPHLDVPSRTYIEIHPANYPSQLAGCIAVGTLIENDTLSNSREAFVHLMALLPQTFIVSVTANYK